MRRARRNGSLAHWPERFSLTRRAAWLRHRTPTFFSGTTRYGRPPHGHASVVHATRWPEAPTRNRRWQRHPAAAFGGEPPLVRPGYRAEGTLPLRGGRGTCRPMTRRAGARLVVAVPLGLGGLTTWCRRSWMSAPKSGGAKRSDLLLSGLEAEGGGSLCEWTALPCRARSSSPVAQFTALDGTRFLATVDRAQDVRPIWKPTP